MKKLLAVIVVAFVAAAAVWLVGRIQLANRLATVPELLPETTLALIEVPDFQRARTQWHGSDLYQIWREPTVQAWLRTPLAQLPKDGGGRQMLEDFLRLGPTHGFVALTSLENNEPKLLGGFHFDKSPEEVRTFIEPRKAEWLRKTGGAKREAAVYEQHQIETVSVSHFVFASVVCDDHWFFLANDLAALKALLDRVDHRGEKSPSLHTNKTFIDATRYLPGDYVGSLFIDPRPFVEKLIPLVAMTGQSLPMDQLNRLRQIRTLSTTFGFDHGKMHETDFAAMPWMGAERKLEGRLLGVAGANTFFYSAARIPWPETMFSPAATGAVGLPAALQQLTAALKARGIAEKDLREAFGEELEVVGDWPANSHWPTLQATLPVKDPARARKIAEALTSVEIAGMPWIRSEKNGATFYSAQLSGGIFSIQLALAVSDQMMLAGSDAAAIEAALTRIASPANELEKSAIFRDASRQVPAGESAFNYVDTRLLFERTDASLRPLLLMGAAFSPALGKNVDPAKLPPQEAIAKHLSPIVMSQRYEKEGYVTESLGPVTFRAATIGLVGTVGVLFVNLQDRFKGSSLLPGGPPSNPLSSPAATASPSPSASPF
jgi:hypothetical protein